MSRNASAWSFTEQDGLIGCKYTGSALMAEVVCERQVVWRCHCNDIAAGEMVDQKSSMFETVAVWCRPIAVGRICRHARHPWAWETTADVWRDGDMYFTKNTDDTAGYPWLGWQMKRHCCSDPVSDLGKTLSSMNGDGTSRKRFWILGYPVNTATAFIGDSGWVFYWYQKLILSNDLSDHCLDDGTTPQEALNRT